MDKPTTALLDPYIQDAVGKLINTIDTKVMKSGPVQSAIMGALEGLNSALSITPDEQTAALTRGKLRTGPGEGIA